MVLTVSIHHVFGHAFSLDVDLDIGPGITAFVGASGSGKTSTVLTIAGLLPKVHPSIVFDGEVWDEPKRGMLVPPERRGVSFVPQSLALFPHLSARENVAFPIAGSSRARLQQADQLLSRMRIGHVAGRHPSDLSGGEAQRVALARAMARKPRLVLLDEPFSALDRLTRLAMYEVLGDWLAEAGVPAVIVTHDEREAERFASATIAFVDGHAVGEPRLRAWEARGRQRSSTWMGCFAGE